jgi:hypothetical protein
MKPTWKLNESREGIFYTEWDEYPSGTFFGIPTTSGTGLLIPGTLFCGVKNPHGANKGRRSLSGLVVWAPVYEGQPDLGGLL